MKPLKIRLIVLVLLVAALAGCHRSAKVLFYAEPQINEGLLVPVDIIATTRDKSKEIIGIGPDEWFSSKLRESMNEDQLLRLAIRNGETRKVKFKGPKGTDAFIVFADFQGIVDRDRQQQVFFPKCSKRTFYIEVQNKKLVVLAKKKKEK